MEAIEKEALREKHTKIVETIDVNDVVHGLFQKKVVPSFECVERITKCGVTKQDKATELLHVVTKSDNPRSFTIFLEVLQESYRYLTKEIKDTVVKLRRKRLRLQCHQIKYDTTVKESDLTSVKTVQNHHCRNSCPLSPNICTDCRNPLTPTISIEAGVSCNCKTRPQKRPTSCGIDSNIGHLPPSDLTDLKYLYKPGTMLNEATVSFEQNIIARDIADDHLLTNKSAYIAESSFESVSANKNHPFMNNETEEKQTDIKKIHASLEINQPVMLKCLATPPAPKVENVVPCFTSVDTVDGTMKSSNTPEETCLVQKLSIKEKCTKAPPAYDVNLKNESLNCENKVSNWDKKTSYVHSNEADPILDKADPLLVYNNSGWPKTAPDFKSNLSPTTLNVKPSKPILNEDFECITLNRESQSESFGFKFVPGFGERKRFKGDSDYYITEIIPGSIASKFKQIKVNDTLKSVNGKIIKHLRYDEVVRLFQHSLTVKLEIQPYHSLEKTCL